jgi:site-specific DNA-methyltransferase (adenine-specific)
LPDDETFQKICNEWNELDKYKTIINSANREVVGKYEGDAGGLGGERLGSKGGDITIPATNVAKDWEGWGTALKPAHEPIVMARKPIEGTVAENTLQYGVGGLNIDGTRIQMQDGDKMDIRRYNAYHDTFNSYEDGESAKGKEYVVAEPHAGGRWPANVIINEEGDEEWKRYFYCPKASKKDRDEGNIHPTVKPTDLMKYLIRLVTPKDGIVLDPFMGSGSTGKAAMQEGMWFVGIEREKEYYEIAKQRIEHEMDKRKFW